MTYTTFPNSTPINTTAQSNGVNTHATPVTHGVPGFSQGSAVGVAGSGTTPFNQVLPQNGVGFAAPTGIPAFGTPFAYPLGTAFGSTPWNAGFPGLFPSIYNTVNGFGGQIPFTGIPGTLGAYPTAGTPITYPSFINGQSGLPFALNHANNGQFTNPMFGMLNRPVNTPWSSPVFNGLPFGSSSIPQTFGYNLNASPFGVSFPHQNVPTAAWNSLPWNSLPWNTIGTTPSLPYGVAAGGATWNSQPMHVQPNFLQGLGSGFQYIPYANTFTNPGMTPSGYPQNWFGTVGTTQNSLPLNPTTWNAFATAIPSFNSNFPGFGGVTPSFGATTPWNFNTTIPFNTYGTDVMYPGAWYNPFFNGQISNGQFNNGQFNNGQFNNGQFFNGQFLNSHLFNGGVTPYFGGIPFGSFNGLNTLGYPFLYNTGLTPLGYGQAIGATPLQPSTFAAAAGECATIRQAA